MDSKPTSILHAGILSATAFMHAVLTVGSSCAQLLHPENSFLVLIYYLWLLRLFLSPCRQRFLSLGRKECEIEVCLVAKFSNFLFFVPWPVGSLHVNHHLWQTNKQTKKKMKQIFGYNDKSLGVSLVFYPLRFSPRPYDQFRHTSLDMLLILGMGSNLWYKH